MSLSVFDLHCDTAYRLLGKNFDEHFSLRSNQFHIDLQRASKFSRYVQCFSCFTAPQDVLPIPVAPQQMFHRQYEVIMAQLQENQHLIRQATNADEIKRNCADGLISAILTLEGTCGFDYEVDCLDDFYQKGFRITTLGWNEQNPLAGSHRTGGALTEQGRSYVQKAQSLGMIVDVSHISDAAFWDIMNITTAPVIATHSNSRAICPVSRNLTDSMFCAIADIGGVVGINLYTEFLSVHASIDAVCDHIFHFLELDPTGKHIALGGDLDGCDSLPCGFCGIQDYSKIAHRLQMRGLDTATIDNIFWNNALGVIARCCT